MLNVVVSDTSENLSFSISDAENLAREMAEKKRLASIYDLVDDTVIDAVCCRALHGRSSTDDTNQEAILATRKISW